METFLCGLCSYCSAISQCANSKRHVGRFRLSALLQAIRARCLRGQEELTGHRFMCLSTMLSSLLQLKSGETILHKFDLCIAIGELKYLGSVCKGTVTTARLFFFFNLVSPSQLGWCKLKALNLTLDNLSQKHGGLLIMLFFFSCIRAALIFVCRIM